MKIFLYSILGIVSAIIIGGICLIYFFLGLPELKIPPNSTELEKIEIVDKWFQTLQKENKFNGAVLFVKEENILLSKGYGFTNEKKENLITENTSFRLASVSKQFTAAGIMLLQQNGRLDYDSFVSKYIQNFPYKEVTIRNLLNQTSGIPDIYMELAVSEEKNIKILTNKIALELLIKKDSISEFEPNEHYLYSNTDYIILARIIELISGLTFEDYMKSELFEPMGMKNTRVWNLMSDESTFKNKADDFMNNFGDMMPLKTTFIDGIAGDGAVFSSINDLVIWDEFWYGNTLLDSNNLKEAFKRPTLSTQEESNYGFGWLLTETGAWHNGAWLGANTTIIRNTKEKACFVVLDNSQNIFFHEQILNELETQNLFISR